MGGGLQASRAHRNARGTDGSALVGHDVRRSRPQDLLHHATHVAAEGTRSDQPGERQREHRSSVARATGLRTRRTSTSGRCHQPAWGRERELRRRGDRSSPPGGREVHGRGTSGSGAGTGRFGLSSGPTRSLRRSAFALSRPGPHSFEDLRFRRNGVGHHRAPDPAHLRRSRHGLRHCRHRPRLARDHGCGLSGSRSLQRVSPTESGRPTQRLHVGSTKRPTLSGQPLPQAPQVLATTPLNLPDRSRREGPGVAARRSAWSGTARHRRRATAERDQVSRRPT